jgi:acyl-coenzyme A thioesterase PaaI-like protein
MTDLVSPPSASSLVIELQRKFASQSTCFGCGPANSLGLQINSQVRLQENYDPKVQEIFAEWTPKKEHEAFPGMLNGGIIGSLLDCHCNWTAAYTLMRASHLDQPPCTVTAEYTIKLLRPTPTDGPVRLVARAVEVLEDRVTVEGTLFGAHQKPCATCRGVFVAVKPGHPAYHRW